MIPLDAFSNKGCPPQVPTDKVNLGEYRSLCLTLTNEQGCPLDVSHADEVKPCVENPAPTSSSSMSSSSQSSAQNQSSSSMLPVPGAPLPTGWTASYLVKEMYWLHELINKPARVQDASQGIFSVQFSAADFTKGTIGYPGTFLSELVIKDAQGRRRVTGPRYLQVIPTLDYQSQGPITVAEVRMAIMDYPCSNTLLDDYEFTEAEVMFAIRRPIDRWNEMTPNILVYTPATFPWREHWLSCTIGYLLKSAAHKARRNFMQYQGGGLSVNDNSFYGDYLELGNQLIAEYDEWAKHKKIEMNVANGIGSLGSAYGRYWYWQRNR
jgi:hypothetical protein